ncbi:hypothetical protein A1D31_39875 [Bradyrhizobium liaoningense]|nr:hypothetical protein A1D31_39875 [Bradyrhizobium liaoningense]
MAALGPAPSGQSVDQPSPPPWVQDTATSHRQFLHEAGSPLSAVPEETVHDVSHATPQGFRHSIERLAPKQMVERLRHLDLAPNPEQPTMTYEIQGHRYTAAFDPSGRLRLLHNPLEAQVLGVGQAGIPEFGAFFIGARDPSGKLLPEQWASLALIEKLRDEGCMPSANHPTTILLNGKPYNAELTEGGFVRLMRRRAWDRR